jgi:FAD/FMN-containing dehydrogenase
MTTLKINKASLDDFRKAVSGNVITPSDSNYDQARKVWNSMIDRRPALIAQCRGASDVAAAVRYAREKELLVAVRGGGHNVAGYAVCDGGLVIDLSLMRDVSVDPHNRTVRVGAGARWADVDQATQPYGLAAPGGEVSKTGVAGLTLGGGVGYLRRKYGLSCDSLLSVEMVTAGGRIVQADPGENADLFWALRGGGGNFGVVTSFVFRLHPVGPEVMALNPYYPLAEAVQVMSSWREFTAAAPEEATTAFAIWGLPAHPDIPARLHGTSVCLMDGMYAGQPSVGEEVFRPLRELNGTLMDFSGRVPYVEAQRAFDAFFPDGGLYYWKSHFMDALSDAAIRTIVSTAKERPDPRILVIIRHLGGAIGRVDADATAFRNRRANYMISIDGAWSDPAESDRNIAWVRNFWEIMKPFSNGGVYLNFPGFDEGEGERWQTSHGDNYKRLAEVKRKYDPTNLFRMNQNIKPANQPVEANR